MSEEKGIKEMDEARLKRIEDKLDRLSEGLTQLIRLDERMVTLFKRMDVLDARNEALAERVTALEKINSARGPLFVWLERAGIALIGAMVAWVVRQNLGP
jgi:hypothetical protein